ncbi:MAG: glycosyltransferase family protein [Acidobacteriaceae bacterium]|nr:glycosyltransferase family protein [Acidobacteriaceae bacterium]
MKTVAIVQARMGSSRLPGKVLMDLGGRTVLGRVVKRVNRAVLVQQVVVATSSVPPDDAVASECQRLGVECFRGSEDDVLDRYYGCAQTFSADTVIRITADCPIVDPALVDATLRAFHENPCDYASNALVSWYPRGLDVEVFTIEALSWAWREARKAYEREHVTPYLYEHPELFGLVSVEAHCDYSQHRWTLDTAEDMELLRAIYARFGNRDDFGWRDVLQLMEREPELALLNSHVIQKPVHA